MVVHGAQRMTPLCLMIPWLFLLSMKFGMFHWICRSLNLTWGCTFTSDTGIQSQPIQMLAVSQLSGIFGPGFRGVSCTTDTSWTPVSGFLAISSCWLGCRMNTACCFGELFPFMPSQNPWANWPSTVVYVLCSTATFWPRQREVRSQSAFVFKCQFDAFIHAFISACVAMDHLGMFDSKCIFSQPFLCFGPRVILLFMPTNTF